MQSVRHVFQLHALLLLIMFNGCAGPSSRPEDENFGHARSAFIEACEIMTQRDARANEIDYWKSPEVSGQLVEGCDGKWLVHFCNEIEKENQDEQQRLNQHQTWVIRTWNVADIKAYALDHYEQTIGYVYRFTGTFTNYDRNSRYNTETCDVLVVPGLNKCVVYRDPKWVRGISEYEADSFIDRILK